MSAHILARKRCCTYRFLLGPSADYLVVLACMPRVEVGKGARVLLVVPDLAHQSRVDVAHEHLADGVDAVSWKEACVLVFVKGPAEPGLATY